jgi:hypothetical protein
MLERVGHRRHRAYPALTNAFSISSNRGLQDGDLAPKFIAKCAGSAKESARLQQEVNWIRRAIAQT